jgi:hypothetical protein
MRQLEANRGEFNDTDVVDLVVSPTDLTIKALGTETCIVAESKQSGDARLPLSLLVKIVGMAGSYKEPRTTILLDDKSAKVGRSKVRHPEISVGKRHPHPPSLPVDTSALHMLAVALTMTPKEIVDAGLQNRVDNARKKASAAIGVAVDSLKEFNVTTKDLKPIIDRRVAEAAEVIRRVVKD